MNGGVRVVSTGSVLPGCLRPNRAWLGHKIARFRMGAFNITLYTETSRLKALNVPECRGHASPCPACPEC